MQILRTLSAPACIAATVLLAACHAMPERATSSPTAGVVTLDSLAVTVSAEENRAVSFTNKRSAFYYTQTHRNDHPEHAFFRGFNIAGHRIFSDDPLLVAGKTLDPQTATVVVRPDALVRTYPQGITETLRLFDGQDVVVGHMDNCFLIAVSSSREAALGLYEQAVAEAPAWTTVRRTRLAGVVSDAQYLNSDDLRLAETLHWSQLTTDSLVALAPSLERREQQARLDAILSGTEFARPGVAAAHPVMQQLRTP